jgi:hypothetical protein
VSGFFDASKKADYKTVLTYIEPTQISDRFKIESITGDNSENLVQEFYLTYIKSRASKMTYEITNSEINGDNASVTVKAKYIDGGIILKAAMGEVITKAMSLAFSGQEPTDDEMNKLFLDTINEKANSISDTYKEVTLKIDCVKSDGKWYILEVSDDLVDVVSLGFLSAAGDISDVFEN